jgi:hypothetical protein
MMHSSLSSLLWLVWLAGVFAALSLCVMLLKKSASADSASWKMTFAPFRFNWASTRRVLERTGLISLAFIAGWLVRDRQFNADRHFYSDVLVLARHDDRNFTLQPARMQPWEATTCEPQDWQQGQKMRFMQYQQRHGCKDVSARGAFEFYSENGKRLEVLDAGN